MKKPPNFLLRLMFAGAILFCSQTGWAQYQVIGGSVLDKNPQIGSGGLNSNGAAAYISYLPAISPPSYQLTGYGLISSYSGFTPNLGPSVMQILTGRFNNTAPPAMSTGIKIGGGGYSVGPSMLQTSTPGGGLAVQQQLAPTLGNPLGPSPYMSLLQRTSGGPSASPLEQNSPFGPPAPGEMGGGQGPPSPGQPASWNRMMGVPLGGASPRGLQAGVGSSLAAQFSRSRTLPEVSSEEQGPQGESSDSLDNPSGPDMFATVKPQRNNSLSALARKQRTSWNPFDQTSTAETKTDPWSFDTGKTGQTGNLGGRTVNPQLYASQTLVSSAGSNLPLPAAPNQVPPQPGGSGTSWLDNSGRSEKSAGTDPWRSAIAAAQGGPGGPLGPTDTLADRRGSGRSSPPDRRGGSYAGTGRTDPFATTLQPLDTLQPGGQRTGDQQPGTGEPTRNTAEADATVPLAVRDDIASSQDKAERYLRQAKQALSAGQFYEAIGAFSLASVVLKLTPEDEMQYLEALVAVGNFEQAGGVLEKIVNHVGSIPPLTLDNIKPAARMTMVRFLQAQEATANRLDRRFWVGVLTINQKERATIFRKLQIDLLMSTATQPNISGGFPPKVAKAVLDYLSRSLEQH